MQDTETIQDDINSKDKQSNSENHKEESNQESEEESKEGDNEGEGHEHWFTKRRRWWRFWKSRQCSWWWELFLSKKEKHSPSSHHDYSEIDFSGDEVFELPSNGESFKAGTIFRAAKSWFHNHIKEDDLR